MNADVSNSNQFRLVCPKGSIVLKTYAQPAGPWMQLEWRSDLAEAYALKSADVKFTGSSASKVQGAKNVSQLGHPIRCSTMVGIPRKCPQVVFSPRRANAWRRPVVSPASQSSIQNLLCTYVQDPFTLLPLLGKTPPVLTRRAGSVPLAIHHGVLIQKCGNHQSFEFNRQLSRPAYHDIERQTPSKKRTAAYDQGRETC